MTPRFYYAVTLGFWLAALVLVGVFRRDILGWVVVGALVSIPSFEWKTRAK
jgi:hypothetical protein